MISNKDVGYNKKTGELMLNGEYIPLGTEAILSSRVSALEETVGDSSSGLVKEVDDLSTTVGDSSSGLVKDVDELYTTVGDSSSGLVKDVDDLSMQVAYVATNIIEWDYSTDNAILSGFDRTRLLIGLSTYDTSGLSYIAFLIGENVVDIQAPTADSTHSKPSISKTTSGWQIGKMSGQLGKFVIVEFGFYRNGG